MPRRPAAIAPSRNGPSAKIVHYRASPDACNRCSLKNNCTDSNEGRLLKRHLDSWIESELRRFHRGLSMTLLLLAAIILLAAGIRHSGHQELLVIGSLLVPDRHGRDKARLFFPIAQKGVLTGKRHSPSEMRRGWDGPWSTTNGQFTSCPEWLML